MSGDLTFRAEQARDWMFTASFPLWASEGVDPRGGFAERLSLEGQRIEDADTRVRVQARQTFAFALAHRLGWEPATAETLIAHGVETLTQHCRRPDGLYGRRLAPGQGLTDDTADLYDTGFALLALAAAARTGHAGARTAMADLSAAIDRHLKRPAGEVGYCEALPAPAARRQNPHMHLFEASLAEYETARNPEALRRIEALGALLATRLMTADGTLREVFAADWGGHPDDRLEPGHHYEWVWLLQEQARLTGAAPAPAAATLYATALELTGETGAVALEHSLARELKDATERSWSLTEALKAHLIRMEAGDPAAAARASASFDRLWSRHIAPAPPGGWLDRYGASGAPASTDMPASTGYHIYLAFSELMRAAGVG